MVIEAQLLKSQKKLLFDAIVSIIGETKGFTTQYLNSTTTISHSDEYFFKVYKEYNFFNISYYPSSKSIEQDEYMCKNFNDVYNLYKDWLMCIKPEIEIVDIWALHLSDNHTAYNTTLLSEKFTDEESAQIKAGIDEIKEKLAQQLDLKESLNAINMKLDILGELVSELSRIDWRDHLYGSMVGLVVDNVASSICVQDICTSLQSTYQTICSSLSISQ